MAKKTKMKSKMKSETENEGREITDKQLREAISYYTIHIRCSNCGWNTQKVPRAVQTRYRGRQCSINIPMGTTTKAFLKTYRCGLCRCEGTCKSLGWTSFLDD